jgi:uncharacterized damage-inducible protein DinB
LAFDELLQSLDGVTEAQSWAVLPNLGSDYLHTDASIHGLTLHIAAGKFIYGSVCFRNSEIRYRQLADEVEAFEPSWEAAMAYLKRSHEYWLSTWTDFTDEDLLKEYPHQNDGRLWPGWRFIHVLTTHDYYHAGQIAMLRYGCPETDVPPPSVAEDIRKYCPDTVSW